MRVLLATYDGYSHVMTAFPLVQRLIARGHTVRWLVDRRYWMMVARSGATHVPTAYTPSHLDIPSRPLEQWIRLFQSEAMFQAADLIAAMEEAPTDVLLVDPTMLGVSAMGPGYPDTLIGLLGCVPLLHIPRECEFVLQATLPQCELPLPPQQQERVFFTGPLLPPPMDELSPHEMTRIAADFPRDRPLVLVTQGTLATDPAMLIAPALDALADLPVFVLAQTGQLDLPTPKNARVLPWLPFGRILPMTACVVSNGGYQGAQWCLAAGVPMVIDGKTEDKPEVGRRVAWAGYGMDLSGVPTTPESLRNAVIEVLQNPRYREQAWRLAAQAGLQDSATAACQVLEAERARSVPEVDDAAAA